MSYVININEKQDINRTDDKIGDKKCLKCLMTCLSLCIMNLTNVMNPYVILILPNTTNTSNLDEVEILKFNLIYQIYFVLKDA